MKRFICALALFLGMIAPLATISATAGAVNVFQDCTGSSTGGQDAGGTDVCQSKGSASSNPFVSTMKVVLDLLTFIVGLTALIMLIFAGLRMMWAQGDPAAIKGARNGIIGAIVGLLTAGLAQVIVVYVLNKVG